VACSSNSCRGKTRFRRLRTHGSEMMLNVGDSFFLTHRDQLSHRLPAMPGLFLDFLRLRIAISFVGIRNCPPCAQGIFRYFCETIFFKYLHLNRIRSVCCNLLNAEVAGCSGQLRNYLQLVRRCDRVGLCGGGVMLAHLRPGRHSHPERASGNSCLRGDIGEHAIPHVPVKAISKRRLRTEESPRGCQPSPS